MHAYGAVLDNPDLTAFCVVGDGEAETGPLAGSWHANKFINPVRDGVVVPILALNQYKIANPTILARIPEAELLDLMRGYGYAPHMVAGDGPADVHQQMATAMDACLGTIAEIHRTARDDGDERRRVLEQWLRSYRPEELFDDDGRPIAGLRQAVPAGDRRMSANPVANGGTVLRDLRLPDWPAIGSRTSSTSPSAIGRPRSASSTRRPVRAVE
ncbi:hypothetical protein Ato02nite_054130 [Paractinoplanes toevensis]|uniref:Xylulose 5-phosphate/Fructose 6-phosphate phosphoketolase N-terminal domain-containing protein n=1 Tax=Paractinoplanes toevensis TaxID=571911 RepID=A0A919W5W4_9ACTN|nr:hypothetical protein Ato02nite_054130 [Actinoplanes toevensis]